MSVVVQRLSHLDIVLRFVIFVLVELSRSKPLLVLSYRRAVLTIDFHASREFSSLSVRFHRSTRFDLLAVVKDTG